MTKKERGQYAALCSHLQAESRKNGTQYTKPERPDAHTLDSVTAIVNHSKKDVKTLKIRMKVVCEQMDVLTDFFDTIIKDNPELREYQRIADYLQGSLIEIQERLELI